MHSLKCPRRSAAAVVVTALTATAFAQNTPHGQALEYEMRRAKAHATMPDTMYASTPSDWESHPAHSSVRQSATRPERDEWELALKMSAMVKARENDTAKDLFRKHISGPVVQTKCVGCHVEGGRSEHTRLRFVTDAAAGHVATNYDAFNDFLGVVSDGATLMLDKIAGRRGHGGGVQVRAGSASHGHMQRFLQLLDSINDAGLTLESLFDGVQFKSARKTLYQAAIMFAGRVPTRDEYGLLADGNEDQLRDVIRNLMVGQPFHDFLVRSANDRLLVNNKRFVLFSSEFVTNYNTLQKLYKNELNGASWRIYREYSTGVHHGARVAPLELIAHVGMNDLPYTEVLTADYIMANPQAAHAYGATVEFDDPNDIHEFKPVRVVDYYDGSGEEICVDYCIIDPPGHRIDLPHAGILSTESMLYRHPTTPTNRNRARARWTLLHHLGIDVENMGAREIAPDALVDEDNPTQNNPACNRCHSIIDPVAGLFMNYDERGYYRQHPDPDWFNEQWRLTMGEPGIGGKTAGANQRLPWLAAQLANDERFPDAAVRFWWPSVMGRNVAAAPADRSAPDYDGLRLGAAHQSATVARLAQGFRTGFRDGSPYNLRDLLVELVMTEWFRADRVASDDPLRLVALRDAGASRPLTPEELVAKTDHLTALSWGRIRRVVGPERDRPKSRLTRDYDGYNEVFGGINAGSSIVRTRHYTAPMAQVAKQHASAVSTLAVLRDFFFLPRASDRKLFGGIELSVTPQKHNTRALRSKLIELHTKFFGEYSDAGVDQSLAFLTGVWEHKEGGWPGPPHPYPPPGAIWHYWYGHSDHHYMNGILDDAVVDADYRAFRWNYDVVNPYLFSVDTSQAERRMAEAWSATIAALMMDYRYLHL